MNNTFMANPDKVERKWYVVDATGYTLGRLSSEIAKILRGKNKAVFTPHIDTGDYVIVVNAEKIKVTGKKLDQKIYYHHSDYVGGRKETTLKEMLAKHPERVRCERHASERTSWTSDVQKIICIRWTRSQTCSSETRSSDILIGEGGK